MIRLHRIPLLLVVFAALVPLAAQDVVVSSADPNTASQGTINLNVTVSGKGFKRGAQARWKVTGTEDPGGVTVNSTTYVNPNKVVANIDVTDTAVISKFDVEVQNSDGRNGEGVELFAVTASSAVQKGGDKGKTRTITTFRNCQGDVVRIPGPTCPAPDRIQSDIGSPYEDGMQLVESFVGSSANYGNLFVWLRESSRGLFLDFTDCASPPCSPPITSGVVDDAQITVFVDRVIKDGVHAMTVGQSIDAPMRVYFWLPLITGEKPNFVHFEPAGAGACNNQSTFLKVTRAANVGSKRSWEVSADPNMIACLTMQGGTVLGGTFRMPFKATWVEK